MTTTLRSGNTTVSTISHRVRVTVPPTPTPTPIPTPTAIPVPVTLPPPTFVPPARMLTPSVTSGNGSLAVSWDAPSERGSSRITRYEVEYQARLQTNWSKSSASTTKTTLPGLTNGHSYEVQVRACSRSTGGCGDWSISESGTPSANPGALPARPAGLRANGDLDSTGNVAVRWDAAARATGYRLRYAEETCVDNGDGSATCNPTLPWAANGVTITGTTATIGLPSPPSYITSSYNGVYRIQAQATNTTGASNWSDIVFVYPTITPPGHRILIATGPLYGYQPANAQGSHEFRYVICENTIPSAITASSAIADITAGIDTWETTVDWKDASGNNIVKTEKYALPAGEKCSGAPIAGIRLSPKHNQVMFASNFSMTLAGCIGPPSGCWRSLTWEDSTLVAYGSALSELKKGSILLKSSLGTAWSTQNSNGCSYLQYMAVHEAGHSLGIGRPVNQHPTNTTHSIMSYKDSAQYCEPQAYDVVALMALYQSR